MTVHGSRQTDTTVQVDGMQLNSLMNDGQVQAYFSDAAMAEVTYQTSGVGADVSAGGVRINMIPKEGGNRFSGSAFAGGTNGDWQAEQRHRRTARARAAQRVARRPHLRLSTSASAVRSSRTSCGSSRAGAASPPTRSFAQLLLDTGEVGTGIEDQWIQNQHGPPDVADERRRTSSASTTTAIRSSKGTR